MPYTETPIMEFNGFLTAQPINHKARNLVCVGNLWHWATQLYEFMILAIFLFFKGIFCPFVIGRKRDVI